jgi:hypothetical protein
MGIISSFVSGEAGASDDEGGEEFASPVAGGVEVFLPQAAIKRIRKIPT